MLLKTSLKLYHILAVIWLVLLVVACQPLADDTDDPTDSEPIAREPDDDDDDKTPDVNKFNVKLQNFGPNVLRGYDECANLKSDIVKAGQLLANLTITRNSEWAFRPSQSWDVGDGDLVVTDDVAAGGDTVAPTAEFDGAEGNDGTTNKSSDDGNQDSSGYETNTQVEGVDEGDIVKSDGEYIYVAYRKELVVHDLSGEVLDRQPLPQTNTEEIFNSVKFDPYFYEEPTKGIPGNDGGMPEPAIDPEMGDEGYGGSDMDTGKEPSTDATSDSDGYSDSNPDIDDNQKPEPGYETNETIVALLLHKTDNTHRLVVVSVGYRNNMSHSYSSLVNNYTKTLLYDVGQDGKLTLAGEHIMKGHYQASRKVDGSAFVVASANMRPYLLTEHLSYYQFQAQSEEEYQTAAYQRASEIIPEWSDAIFKGLLGDANGNVSQDDCKNIMQISTMRQGNENVDEEIDLTGGEGVLNAFVQIHSLDIDDGVDSIQQAGAFAPSDYVITYASEKKMILSGEGWHEISPYQWRTTTYLMGFSIENGVPIPEAVGAVPGRIINQFAMDFHNDHLRVASTIDAMWGINENGEWGQQEDSDNLVTVLKFNDDLMEVTGELRGLGKENETITAVRFLGDRGYVVTFERTDPFYTLDLSDPTSPKVGGELEIPGFSNYLHPVGDDYILAVGQDATDTGCIKGFQVALFDVSDMEHPVQLHKHVIEGWSSSTAQSDHKAFRYLAEQKALILPLNYTKPSWDPCGGTDDIVFDEEEFDEEGNQKKESAQIPSDDVNVDVEVVYANSGTSSDGESVTVYEDFQDEYFDGFQIYTIEPQAGKGEGIVPKGSITHGEKYFYSGCGFLSPRSMVFVGGQLVTFKGSTIQSHNFSDILAGDNSTETQWIINLEDSQSSSCYPWY